MRAFPTTVVSQHTICSFFSFAVELSKFTNIQRTDTHRNRCSLLGKLLFTRISIVITYHLASRMIQATVSLPFNVYRTLCICTYNSMRAFHRTTQNEFTQLAHTIIQWDRSFGRYGANRIQVLALFYQIRLVFATVSFVCVFSFFFL